jgi:hypothetical protein
MMVSGAGDPLGESAPLVVAGEGEARGRDVRAHLAFRLHQAMADQVADGLRAVAGTALAPQPVAAADGPGSCSLGGSA